jgi:hypothetical protein
MIMKFIEIKKRWIVIFLVIFFLFITGVKISVWYYENHFMSVKIWHQRLKGGDVFFLRGLKIKTPDNCAFRSPKTSDTYVFASEEIWFLCATSPTSFEYVNLEKSIPDAKGLQRVKNSSEKFTESNEYIHAIFGPKIGLSTISEYYLKRQNITVSSHSQKLAKKFADLLLKYDFRVEVTTSFDRSVLSGATTNKAAKSSK